MLTRRPTTSVSERLVALPTVGDGVPTRGAVVSLSGSPPFLSPPSFLFQLLLLIQKLESIPG